MRRMKTCWQNHPVTRLILLGIIFLLLESYGIFTGCQGGGGGGPSYTPIEQGVDNIVVLGPQVCGEILNPTQIQIRFLAPLDTSSFVPSQVSSNPPLTFGAPIFSSDHLVVTLPIVQQSVTTYTSYTITLFSDPAFSTPLRLTDGRILSGMMSKSFIGAPVDGTSPYISSYSQGPGFNKGARSYAEYISPPLIIGTTPVEFLNVPPHQKDLEITFSERMFKTVVVPSRGNPVVPTVTLPPLINPLEIDLSRRDTNTSTILKNSLLSSYYWPGVLYLIDLGSCSTACSTLKDCSVGSIDMSGMWLSPYMRSTATDPACPYNSACEIAVSKNDDIRAFTTSKVRIDSPAGGWFSSAGLLPRGITTQDIASINLSLFTWSLPSLDTGVGIPATISPAIGQYGYLSWSGDVSGAGWLGLSDGRYWLRATASDGSFDRVYIVKDTVPPVVTITDVSPSNSGYVRGNFSVRVTVNDATSGLNPSTLRVKVTDGAGRLEVVSPIPQDQVFVEYLAFFDLASLGWPDGDVITIQAQAQDYAGNTGLSAQLVYITDMNPPTGTIIQVIPNSYNFYLPGQFTIVMSVTPDPEVSPGISGSGLASIVASVNGIPYIGEYNPATGYYTAQVTMSGGQVTLYAVVCDRVVNCTLSPPLNYVVDTQPPILEVRMITIDPLGNFVEVPNGGRSWEGSLMGFCARVLDNDSGGNIASLSLSVDGGADSADFRTSGNVICSFIYPPGLPGDYLITGQRDLSVGWHTAVVTVQDNVGNVASQTLRFGVTAVQDTWSSWAALTVDKISLFGQPILNFALQELTSKLNHMKGEYGIVRVELRAASQSSTLQAGNVSMNADSALPSGGKISFSVGGTIEGQYFLNLCFKVIPNVWEWKMDWGCFPVDSFYLRIPDIYVGGDMSPEVENHRLQFRLRNFSASAGTVTFLNTSIHNICAGIGDIVGIGTCVGSVEAILNVIAQHTISQPFVHDGVESMLNDKLKRVEFDQDIYRPVGVDLSFVGWRDFVNRHNCMCLTPYNAESFIPPLHSLDDLYVVDARITTASWNWELSEGPSACPPLARFPAPPLHLNITYVPCVGNW